MATKLKLRRVERTPEEIARVAQWASPIGFLAFKTYGVKLLSGLWFSRLFAVSVLLGFGLFAFR